MNAERYMVRAPGKLFVAGEYAVTEPKQDSLIIAVDRYLSVDIQANRSNRLDLPQLKLTDISWKLDEEKVTFSVQDQRLNFIKHVIETFIAYAGEQSPVHIFVTSELDDRSGKKYGLGSSAALSVALMTALLKFSTNSQAAKDPLTIFKLASIAHFKAQGNGSCADIAASTYGGWLNYRSFDSDWLIAQLNQAQSVSALVQSDWPDLKITPLKQPEELHFLIGWTKESAQTAPMVAKVRNLKTEQPERYQAFLQDSQRAVEQIITGFQQGEVEPIFAGITANRAALKMIGTEAGVPIESPALTKLIEAVSTHGAAKTSGAGGGDCGIAFVSDPADCEHIYQLWTKAGIDPLDIHVSTDGVVIY
ncbi:phosphomevalonate kinase [Amphibacillus sp. Q70]|uniref:phosphomevalonate kinase n=1 Tax=Amphibacillus sp. Q70 TaxID=3453416 RepID=UPI003F86638C